MAYQIKVVGMKAPMDSSLETRARIRPPQPLHALGNLAGHELSRWQEFRLLGSQTIYQITSICFSGSEGRKHWALREDWTKVFSFLERLAPLALTNCFWQLKHFYLDSAPGPHEQPNMRKR